VSGLKGKSNREEDLKGTKETGGQAPGYNEYNRRFEEIITISKIIRLNTRRDR